MENNISNDNFLFIFRFGQELPISVQSESSNTWEFGQQKTYIFPIDILVVAENKTHTGKSIKITKILIHLRDLRIKEDKTIMDEEMSENSKEFIRQQGANEAEIKAIVNHLTMLWDIVNKKLINNDDKTAGGFALGMLGIGLGVSAVAATLLGEGGKVGKLGLGLTTVLVSSVVTGAGVVTAYDANTERKNLLRSERENMQKILTLLNKFKSIIYPQKKALKKLRQNIDDRGSPLKTTVGPQIETTLLEINSFIELLQMMNQESEDVKAELFSQAIDQCKNIKQMLKKIKAILLENA